MTKIKLKTSDIYKIKDIALQMFHRTPEFIDLDAKEMQIACIIMGLDQYLTGKGIQVPFEIELKHQGDSDPVDEFGGSDEKM